MVALEDVHIGISPQTGTVYVGTVDDTGDKWLKKVDASGDFFTTLLNFCNPGKTETISGGGVSYAIYIKDVTAMVEVTPDEMAEVLRHMNGEADPKKLSGGLLDEFGNALKSE